MNDNKMTSIELRSTWGLGIIFSLRIMGMFMLLPVLTSYGTGLQGSTKTLIGIAIGIYGLAQAIFQIPFGLLSDRINRKFIIVFGLFVFMLGSIIAATTTSIWGIIIGRALQGSGSISPAVMALLSDLTREQNRTKAMAFIGISIGITFAIAMILSPFITHELGLRGLFWMLALQAVLGIMITLMIVPSAPQHILNRESGIVKNNIIEVLTNRNLAKLNFSIFCLHFLLMSMFIVLPSELEKIGILIVEHWKVYLFTMLIAFIIITPCVVYAEKKYQIKKIFICHIILILIAEILLWKANHHFWFIMIGIQIFFIGFNLIEALLPSLISKESPLGYKGTAMGIYSTSQFTGIAIGGSIGGWIFGHMNAQSVFFIDALITFGWLLLSFCMKEPSYISSLRLTLENCTLQKNELERRFRTHPGVFEVCILFEEKSAYIKIDNKITNRTELEKLLSSSTTVF